MSQNEKSRDESSTLRQAMSNGFIIVTLIRIAAAHAILVAGMVLTGWQFNITAFTHLHPSLIAMNPMTAICFLVTGFTLWLRANGARSVPGGHVAGALAGMVALFAAIRLGGDLTGVDWRIDQVFYSEKLLLETPPNRMAPNSALCFLLVALALLLVHRAASWSGLAARLLAVATIFLSALAVIGYLCGVSRLYGLAGFIGMALHTAVSFVVIAVGVLLLATRPKLRSSLAVQGSDRFLERRITFGFSTSLFVIGLIGAASFASLMQLLEASHLNKLTYQVLAAISELSSDTKDALTGARGYVITGDRSFLTPYEMSAPRLEPKLRELKALMAGDSAQTARLAHLERLTNACRETASRYIQLRTECGFEVARDDVATGEGKSLVNQVRGVVGAIVREESKLLQQRSEAEAASIRMTVGVVALGACTAFILIGLSGIQIRRGMFARSRAEAQRRETEARYRFLADTLPQILWTARPDGSVDYFNFRWQEYTGEPIAITGDARWADIKAFHPDDRPRFIERWKSAVQRGAPFVGEYRFRRAQDGVYRWFLCRGLPRREEQGQIVQWVGTFTDVDDVRRAAEELDRARASAEEASRAKSQFLAHMSHEIRTPLNGVVGTIDLLLGTSLDAQQRRFGLLAKTSAESLTALINDVLDFSKIEAGKLDLESIAFKLHVTVEEVMQMLSQRAAQKGLELACFIDPRVPADVTGDPDRLRQILINLINNAIKFTERGHVTVRISADELADDQAVIRFAVLDSGIGIPEDRMDRLFRSFSQLDRSTTRVYGGTGLGLAISKQLAHLMGGTIGVTSQVGVGSTFWFTARLGRAPASLRPAAVRDDGPPLKVLAVDSHDVGREVLLQQLLSWGFEAAVAADASPALRILSDAHRDRAPFHVAIIDDSLPEMSGARLAGEIKAREDLRGTVLMVLLTVDAVIDTDALRRQGFSGHLVKPVRQSQLFDAIQDALAQASQIPTVPIPTPVAEPARPARSNSRGLILIAEDNEVNLTVASEILKRYGYAHEIARNGAEAVEAAQSGHFDLILMDCQMPVMDGLEATRRIRKLEAEGRLKKRSGRTIPIIALTANAIKGDREICIEAGMDDYICKPLHPGTLAAMIGRFLADANQASSPGRERIAETVPASHARS